MDGLSEALHVSADQLESWCRACLTAAGTPEDEARIVSSSLARAELRGQRSHGLLRLPTYVKRVLAGLIRVGAPLEIVTESTATFTFDAGSGFGHVAATRAMERCIGRAGSVGVAFAVIRNTTHFGTAGTYAELAVGAGMIGVVGSNGAARMAPFGGQRPVIGTNPLAVAVPRREGHPILLDMGTSAAALGKILIAEEAGEPIPEGWALDGSGRPTTYAKEALGGALLPMSGPKGYGLALIIEVLSAILGGAASGRDAGSMYKTWDRPEDLGHIVGALSIDAFGDRESFFVRLERLVDQIRASASDPGSAVYLPGELEWMREDKALRSGLELDEHGVRLLREAAMLSGAGVEL